MTGASPNGHADLFAQRTAYRAARPDVVDLARRYGEWISTSEAAVVKVQLALLNSLRFSRQISRPTYRLAVRDLAATTSMPLRDLRLLGECQLELLRSGLVGSVLILFDPPDSGAEVREE